MELVITSKSKVAIPMTVLNRERYLAFAIESVLAQTFGDWELIVWDDGSTDDSVVIAQNYASFDDRIRAIAMPHLGRARSLKLAIALSTSPYIGILDSDDLLGVDAITKAVDTLDRHPEAGMVYTDRYLLDADGLNLGLEHRNPYSKERLLTDFTTHHFKLFRRDIYNLVGGIDLDFDSAQDWDLALKISEVANIHHLARPLYYYRLHPDSISSTRSKFQIEKSITAIENALLRRGLDRTLRLDTTNGFKLVAK